MRPGRFPKVNDVILAEALRQLIPVAESGVSTHNSLMAFRRAQTVLDMWVRQERGRVEKLGGPLPVVVRMERTFHEGEDYERPKQIRKKTVKRGHQYVM
jgi:hypothetical protein